jgi:peptide/nickel transport system permease protein
MPSLVRKIGGHVLALLATVLLGGFLSAMLVRFAPGFNTDERELDPHLNAQSLQAVREAHERNDNILAFYVDYMKRAVTGDLGTSISLGQPVRVLLHDRIPLTLWLLSLGLGLAWLFALALSMTAAWLRFSVYDTLTTAVSASLLCLPAAVLALLSVLWNISGSLAIALIVFPHTYRYARNLMVKAYSQPHIIAARAKGVGEARILFWHVVPVVAPQLLALAGVSVSMAIGATIPVEALCGLPGIGQLAWQAALARDLPLLVNVTILVTLVTLLANSSADVIGSILRRQEA